jgi:signal transduction histidine kinase/CheY-like chemotaxis protein
MELARVAAAMLRRLAGDGTAEPGYEDHIRFLERQERVLQFAEDSFKHATATAPVGGAVDAAAVLGRIYAHETEADALWMEIVAHHRAERLQNEHALMDHSRRALALVLAGVVVFAVAIGLLIGYVRQRVVAPLIALGRLTASVAAGDLSHHIAVTRIDEIGQLQRSFNQMVVDLQRQHRELSELVESLSHSRDAAEAASQAKSDFLANVSHEIRTPMNGVIVSLDLLHESASNQEQRDLAEAARTSARSLLGMLNDLLDFSRIEAGRLELESVNFQPRRLVTELVELHGKRAAAKGLALNCRVAGEVPTTLCGDPTRLGQVLLNLLDNAIKFTAQGSIEVSVSVDAPESRPSGSPDPTAQPRVWLRFRVTDSGIGVPEDRAHKIFQPFYQADGSATRKYGGTGLGLGIAQRLVRMMGGDIGFDRVAGHGSSFWFTAGLLPEAAHEVAVAPEASPPRPLPEGATVLLVEDHPISRDVMARMLTRRGLRVTCAENGRVALEAAAAQAFDLILMDCQMPEMDGFEATRAIRALGGARAHVAIVALTAYGLSGPDGLSGSKQRYLDAGFDDLVSKPYTLDDIEDKLYRWLVLERRSRVGASGAS